MQATVSSPCINICALDEQSGFCKGCFRNAEEVANWLYYSDDEKRVVLVRLEERRIREDENSRSREQ